MLKHQPVLIIFLLLLLSLAILDRFFEVPVVTYFTIVFFFIGIEIYGASVISSGFHIEAVCSGDTLRKEVALTFDDGPHENTGKILDILRSQKATATFFLIGKNIPGHENIVIRMIEEGHTVGNHSFAHNFWYDLKNKKNFTDDLKKADEIIFKVTSRKPRFFRPPYGVTTPPMAKAIKALGHSVIGWNIRSLDTRKEDPRIILRRIVKQLKPGSIVLLHDPIAGTELVLNDLLTELKTQQYNIVPLSSLIDRAAYA